MADPRSNQAQAARPSGSLDNTVDSIRSCYGHMQNLIERTCNLADRVTGAEPPSPSQKNTLESVDPGHVMGKLEAEIRRLHDRIEQLGVQLNRLEAL